MEKKNHYYNLSCCVKVLVPFDETEFWTHFLRTRAADVIDGGTTNVLSRYLRLKNYDYVVRLTSDCPNVPPMVINKAVFTAIHQEMDYLTNAWGEYRTAIDGHDVEIISSKAMQWLEDHAKSDYDTEHVTPAIRNYGSELRKGVLINKEDMSMIKTCIDTPDEYCAAVRRFESSTMKRYNAIGRGINVFEY